jgi:hypothetical protein
VKELYRREAIDFIYLEYVDTNGLFWELVEKLGYEPNRSTVPYTNGVVAPTPISDANGIYLTLWTIQCIWARALVGCWRSSNSSSCSSTPAVRRLLLSD